MGGPGRGSVRLAWDRFFRYTIPIPIPNPIPIPLLSCLPLAACVLSSFTGLAGSSCSCYFFVVFTTAAAAVEAAAA